MPKPRCEFKTTTGKQCKRAAAEEGLCKQHAEEFKFDDTMCRVFGCERPVAAKGKCITHYQRERRRLQAGSDAETASDESLMVKHKYVHLVKSTVDDATHSVLMKLAKQRKCGCWTLVREAMQEFVGRHG